MSTTAKNNIVRSDSAYSVIEDSANFLGTLTANQGDLIALDTTAHVFKVIAADGDTTSFLGVMTQSVSGGKLLSAYVTSVDTSQGVTDIAGPVAGVTSSLILNTSDAFHPGDKVYPLGAAGGTQTVTSSSNTGARKPCGIYVGPTVASAAAGQTGIIKIIPQYPLAWT